MKLKPVGKRLLVQKIQAEKKGIIFVERTDDPYHATLIELGDKSEIKANVGDRLLMAPYTGIVMDGANKEQPILLVNDNDVIGVLYE